MVCIYCGGKLSVMNSRIQRNRNQTWRRRKCEQCQAVFTSTEAVELTRAVSVQKDGKLHHFSRDKLFTSIYESCRHRPNASTDASHLTETVIAQLLEHATKGLLPVETIISTATDVLQRFDNAAAVQYAAFHPL